MDKLVNAIEPILLKLSEIFNISVNLIQENAEEYILMYGKYILAKQITTGVALSLIVGSIVGGFILIFFCYDDYREEWYVKNPKTRVMIFCAPIILGLLLTAIDLVPYLIAPEMYSIEQIMSLIK